MSSCVTGLQGHCSGRVIKHYPAVPISAAHGWIAVVSWQSWKNLNLTASLLGVFPTTCICFMCENFQQRQKVNLRVIFSLYSSAGLQHTVSRTLPTSGRVQGMLKRSKSVPQQKTVPFVNIPLADGQVFFFKHFQLKSS